MKGMVNAVAILKIKKHPRTIDALIKWIEQRLFHDEYKAPTEQDLHIWLKHAKKFKREQNNLNRQMETMKAYMFGAGIDDAYEKWAKQYLETGDDDETKDDLSPKERREGVEHHGSQT